MTDALENLRQHLSDELGATLRTARLDRGELTVELSREGFSAACLLLRDDASCAFDLLAKAIWPGRCQLASAKKCNAQTETIPLRFLKVFTMHVSLAKHVAYIMYPIVYAGRQKNKEIVQMCTNHTRIAGQRRQSPRCPFYGRIIEKFILE